MTPGLILALLKSTERGKVRKQEVVTPLWGVFWRRPAPNLAPFVEVGKEVSAVDTVCIVEAMKMMNEIPAEVTGTVVEILVEDGQEVQAGTVLMIIETEWA